MGCERLWEAVRDGRPAVGPLRRFDATLTNCRVAGEVDDALLVEHGDPRRRRTTTRAAQMAVIAAELAMTDARLANGAVTPDGLAVLVGTALGGWSDGEQQGAIMLERGARRVNPFVAAGAPNHGPGVEVAAAVGAQGPQYTFSSGCPSSLQALAHGAALIESGIAETCLVGGAEAPLSPMVFAALCRTNELATGEDAATACRPFDVAHDGMVLSEASAFLVLEPLERARARGARVYATILGGSFSCDAQGMYGADPTGAAGAQALRRLLAATATGADQIDYICAHANASPLFDGKEIAVLSAALGECLPAIPISSIKGVLGHPFGASGALQAAIAVLAMRDGIIPPTANLETPAPACRARHVVGAPLRGALRRALITSYGYGGVNGYLLLGAVDG
ncbi:beta-ketoacyl-[acyl-carrier-protein] synthase family protein [bacterium]|nr:beta-ketoacyl-[acyl-carrier-protein] synthase family protein [bacterium]